MLAVFSPANCLAQTTPSAASLGNQVTSQASGAGSISSNLGSVKASLGTSSPVAGEHGPLGLGKPRTFPIVRHLKERCAINKAKIRSSPLGKLLEGPRKILSKATGGVVSAEATPNHVELAAAGPQGASAKIKKDQLESPKRLAAIQYLATVDCHWYPEALTQLTLALRTDRSECVRFEAAKILTGCGCCTPQLFKHSKSVLPEQAPMGIRRDDLCGSVSKQHSP